MKIKRENNIPNHIAIVMDGNGRWALNKNLDRFKGHEKGVRVVKEVTKYCSEIIARKIKSTILRINYVGTSKIKKRNSFSDWIYKNQTKNGANLLPVLLNI